MSSQIKLFFFHFGSYKMLCYTDTRYVQIVLKVEILNLGQSCMQRFNENFAFQKFKDSTGCYLDWNADIKQHYSISQKCFAKSHIFPSKRSARNDLKIFFCYFNKTEFTISCNRAFHTIERYLNGLQPIKLLYHLWPTWYRFDLGLIYPHVK